MNNRICNLIEYLPPALKDIKEFNILFEIINSEINEFNSCKQDVLKQNFIDTATWGLSLWEKRFAIKTDLNKSYEERRELLKAKRRQYGVATKSKIKLVSEAFLNNGTADIYEYESIYTFLIDLKSTNGFPYNLNNLYKLIDEIKPAHLRANYKLTSILNSKLYIGTYINSGEEITVYPYITKELTTKGTINIGVGSNSILENITVYPKGR